jgi:type-F conjugative transfer system pilin assembly protein TrbC
MPICKLPCSKLVGRLPALALVLAPTVALSEKAPKPAAQSALQAQGDTAMARLKAAIAAQQEHGAAGIALPEIPAMPETARRRAFDGLHRRAPSSQAEQRARQALIQSRAALAAERETASLRISQALGLTAPDRAALAGGVLPSAPKGYVPVLFASSSMPITELRAYAGQLELAGGVIAFRGMPGGLRKVTPMARLSAQILRQDAGCEGPACAMRNVQVIIDPLLFRQHGVTRVPALTMIPGDPTQPYCEREEGSPTGSQTVFGDAALSGLLAEYSRLGGKEEVRDAQTRLERR